VFANSFNVQDRILYHNFYYDHVKDHLEVPSIYDEKIFKEQVLNSEEHKKKDILESYSLLSAYFPKLILRSILYFRYLEPNPDHLKTILQYSFLNKVMALRDKVDSSIDQNQRAKYLGIIKDITEHQTFSFIRLFQEFNPIFEAKAEAIAQMDLKENFHTALIETRMVNYHFTNQKDIYQLSHLGMIPGNHIELILSNQVDEKRMKWYHEHAIYNGGQFNIDHPYLQMPTSHLFTGHPAFHQPLFAKIKDMIKMAQETILIDIHLLGGTLGGTLAKFLIEQTKEKVVSNPNFKVLLLNQINNESPIREELIPIHQYIREQIERDPIINKSFLLLPLVESDSTQQMNLNSDYSKIFVIDGNTNHPAAYLGTHNWTDHAGAFDLNSAIYIEGPSATLVQHSYYRDIELALIQNNSNDILNFFKITKDEIPYRGLSKIRLIESHNNAQQDRTRDSIVSLIKNSTQNIFIDQAFLYDRYIVDTLIKKKIENKNIDIRVIVDNNSHLNMSGFPNTIFIDELTKYGIEVRSRITHSTNHYFVNGAAEAFYQKNHRNLISSDGKRIIMNPMSMSPKELKGQKRGLGIEILNSKITRQYEIQYLATWSSPEKVQNMDIEHFRLKIEERSFERDFSHLINDIAAFLIRSDIEIEN